MVLDGERSGKLNHSRTILDSTSGNTGIAYAMIGANRGYKVKLVPAGERVGRAEEDFEGLRRGDRLQRSRGRLRRRDSPRPPDLHGRPRPVFLPRSVQQFGKLEGAFRAHRSRDHQPNRWAADAFHFRDGHQRDVHRREWRLRRDLPDVQCWSAQPSSGFHGLEGLKHMPTAIRPGFTTKSSPTATCGSRPRTPTRWSAAWPKKRDCWWGFRPAAMSTLRPLIARDLVARGETGTIVTVLCDSAEKYLSEHFWDD